MSSDLEWLAGDLDAGPGSSARTPNCLAENIFATHVRLHKEEGFEEWEYEIRLRGYDYSNEGDIVHLVDKESFVTAYKITKKNSYRDDNGSFLTVFRLEEIGFSDD